MTNIKRKMIQWGEEKTSKQQQIQLKLQKETKI